jgi:3-phenylpropionate/trans-cinnamate dioxygenase ferredoxin reductase component
VPPYQRPPLSKAYLLGEMALERLFLRPEAWYADQRHPLVLGTRPRRIDRARAKGGWGARRTPMTSWC